MTRRWLRSGEQILATKKMRSCSITEPEFILVKLASDKIVHRQVQRMTRWERMTLEEFMSAALPPGVRP